MALHTHTIMARQTKVHPHPWWPGGRYRDSGLREPVYPPLSARSEEDPTEHGAGAARSPGDTQA